MSANVVVVGSCMVDYIWRSPRLPKPGETIVGTGFVQKYGGKGANQCISAARLGATTHFIACVGKDFHGEEYQKVLKKENIDISHVYMLSNQSTGSAQITVADNGENSIIILPQANEFLLPNHVSDAADVIKNASVLLCQFETPLKTTLEALKLCKVNGVTSIVNGAPAVENVDPEILKLCDIFCVNETEAQVMTGMESIGLHNAQEATDKLLDQGCNSVIITLGGSGSVYAEKSDRNVVKVPGRALQAVDTTGAGDSFLGALAYFKAHHSTLTMTECIRRASVVAGESVMKHGTQDSFPTRAELPENLFMS